MRTPTMTATAARRSAMLDQAAAGRREAAARQERASFLCVECHAPDGEHVSECRTGSALCLLCSEAGESVPATVFDHALDALAWGLAPHPLCADCAALPETLRPEEVA